MKLPRTCLRISEICVVWCLFISLVPQQLSAQEETNPVTISIAGAIDSELTPLVYVDGVLAGAIDGTIRVPASTESTVEVGLPQARQPLYSLALGPKQFGNGRADVVTTSYSHSGGNPDAVWSAVSLEPNAIAEVELKAASPNSYEVKLPANPYESYTNIIEVFGLEKSSKNWLEAIPEANDESRLKGVDHLIAAASETHWSGAYPAAVRNSWPQPGYPERAWQITSEPAGAKIMTQLGDKGTTNRTVQLPDLSETYVVLRLAGYVDCPHHQCTMIDQGTFIDLQCSLKKK